MILYSPWSSDRSFTSVDAHVDFPEPWRPVMPRMMGVSGDSACCFWIRGRRVSSALRMFCSRLAMVELVTLGFIKLCYSLVHKSVV